jgi:hypothetical protein
MNCAAIAGSMADEKCAVCSKPINEGDPMVFDHGDYLHETCWRTLSSQDTIRESRKLIRQSRELIDRPPTEWSPKNDHDGNGWPICPACKEPLRPAQSAMRSGAYMLHISCPESSH